MFQPRKANEKNLLSEPIKAATLSEKQILIRRKFKSHNNLITEEEFLLLQHPQRWHGGVTQPE